MNRQEDTLRDRSRGANPKLAAVLAVALFAALAAIGAGCGEKSEDESAGPEDFSLALDFYVNPDHAGIYTALENGYFADAGLDVKPTVPADPSAPIKQVAAGRADLAISYEPEVMLARDQGLDVVAVAALVQRPLTSLISLPEAGIKDPADLEGKRVVTAGIPYQTAYLDTILRDDGVDPADVDQTDVGLNLMQPVLSGSADAMFGGFLNVEGVQLQQDGKDPLIAPVDELGIPTYDELVLVANGDRVAEDPESIRLFIAALERGTADAEDDPQAATDALLAASPELDEKLTLAQVRKTLPYFEPPEGKPYGWMDPGEWTGFAGFMADQGQIEQRLDAADLLTNDLLPGEIPG
jgi:putative hydroxymethylpyrimidine transport system substrate-binding protein